ncbi:MAG TPA: hypothetical protein GXX19_00945 [Syntrophomonadaceae bacterium]|nr:hypothetical protein [Syntrophomonadaceae bacterium]
MVKERIVPCTKKKRGVVLPVCLICEQTPPDGIAGGILVSGRFLCAACEDEIVHTRVGDSRYSHLKDKVKRIWARVK